MNLLFPIISALLQASSFTIDKVILSIKKVTYRAYLGISFPMIFLISIILFLLFRPPFGIFLLQGRFGIFIIIFIFLNLTSNFIYYRALDDDNLGEIETLGMLNSIPIIILASLIFTDERKLIIIIPSLIASIAVFWSHWENHRFRLARKTKLFLLWTFLGTPIIASVAKELLTIWHPIVLQMIADGAVAFIFAPLFSKSAERIPWKAYYLLILTNIFTSIAWILFYFSYQRLGIIHTILIFSLQPLLVYLAALFFLKEKPYWKKNVAFAIVLASITTTQIL